jgi:E3 ubiquitin-protein ligase TRIP12
VSSPQTFSMHLLTFCVALLDSIKADHGFNMDSKSVRNLLQVMSELSATEKRDFLQFVTGSPKLPIGGWCTPTISF